MVENFFKKHNIREPLKPREPSAPKIKGKTGKTSIKEDIEFVAGSLRKNPEIKQEPVIQRAEYDGLFHFIKETQKEGEKGREEVVVKNGDIVKKDQKVGYLKCKGVQKEIFTSANGIISGLPENWTSVKGREELFTITPTSEK